MPSQHTPSNLFTRRRILCLGGTGAIGGLAYYLGWPVRGDQGTNSPPHAETAAHQPQPFDHPSAESSAGVPRREDFLPHLNSEFRLGDSGTSCKLVEVGVAQELVSPKAAFISFSLLFAAPKELIAESKIHQLIHGKLGTIELFISPVGQSGECVYLEAVCSQRV